MKITWVLLILSIVVIATVMIGMLLAHRAPVTGGAKAYRRAVPTRPLGTPPTHVIKDLKRWPASRAENIVREEFEKLTGKKFPTVYPSWLEGMELDGYCDELRLAFEFQGPQHTMFSSKYDKKYATYAKRVRDDERKVTLCRENKVFLIPIDYIIPRIQLNNYLRSRLHDYCNWEGSVCTEHPMNLYTHRPIPYIDPVIHKPFVLGE